MDPEKIGSFGREGPPALTYEGYLEIARLLSLQHPASSPPDRDELLFIIVHQVHELWFKLVLWELDRARDDMDGDLARRATHHIRRVIEIQRSTLDAIHVLETMSSSDFLRFRDHLKPASGFQSVQFREIEALCGIRNPNIVKALDAGTDSVGRLERRLREPSLEEAFYSLLRRRGFDVTPRSSGASEPRRTESAVRALLPIYRRPDEHAELFDLAEALIAFDEGLGLWRHHHVAMAARMIGGKIGTGGSAGVGYLRTTLDARAFPDLWELRTELTPEA